MRIRPVESKSDLRAFIQFPYDHYKDDPVWVPPLRFEQRKLFDPSKNPFLDHCEYQLFLLEDDRGTLIGRIAAFIDHIAMEYWGEQIGFFGYYECIQDAKASQLLLETARDWLLEKGCTSMRGPWSFVTQEWGSVVEGFTPSPVIMGPYNPPYYNEDYADFGLEKVQDMLCWSIDGARYEIPERIMRLTDAVAKRYKVKTRHINLKDYEKEVKHFIDLSNDSIIDNWGYSPVTEDEAQDMADDLRLVVQARAVIFAENEAGEVIGFAVALPDLNSLLKGGNGRLFPTGIFKLLFGLPRLNRYRMFALGVAPEYQGKAIDSLLYRALYESIYSEDMWMEINYVLDDNWPMINAIKKLNASPLRRYRVFEMGI